MKKTIVIVLILTHFIAPAKTIHLEECYQNARENFPVLKQSKIWAEISGLKQENLKTNWLPSVNINAQATYQSDVPGIDIPLPNISIPTVSKDQYKAYAEIKQTIWDGGLTQSNSKIEEATLKTQLSQVEVELYKLNEQVSQVFFTALVVQQQISVLNAQKVVLNEKLQAIESAIKNDFAEASSGLVLEAEILKLEQTKVELEAAKSTSIKILGILTGTEIGENDELEFSASNENIQKELNRPELQLFNNQSKQLGLQLDLLDKSRNPRIFGFGQAGFGKPGLNLLSNDFAPYYLVGVGVSWNAFDWKNTFRKKKIIQLNQQLIETQRETFTQNINILLAQQLTQIAKLNSLLENDKTLIELRKQITKAAASKLENDLITTSDYAVELQNETSAKINFEIHKIQLAQAREKYRVIAGTEKLQQN